MGRAGSRSSSLHASEEDLLFVTDQESARATEAEPAAEQAARTTRAPEAQSGRSPRNEAFGTGVASPPCGEDAQALADIAASPENGPVKTPSGADAEAHTRARDHSEKTPSEIQVVTLSPLAFGQLRRFAFLRWTGTVGALLLGIGGLGAGALPVVDNPYTHAPFGSIMGRMLQTSMMLCFIGVGLLVLAWLGMSAFCGVQFRHRSRIDSVVSVSMLRRTFIAWTLPIVVSAPMFTQDIYSYLANGKIVRLEMDPYSGGPVDLLGTDDPLARSVPFIWAHSPSPYGPVSLGIAEWISIATGDSIALGVIAHRLVSIAGVAIAAWAMYRLARRCRVLPQAALWLGILNPLTLLHLIAGIHNESIMLGLALAGFEVGLIGCDRIRLELHRSGWLLVGASGFLISCAGMVKVSGFIGLGFVGVVLARSLHARGQRRGIALIVAIAVQAVLLVASIAIVTIASGIGIGWITGQGGAATIRSWMSLSTSVGVISGWWAMVLGLGDHTEAILSFTRLIGVGIAVAFMLRMLLASFAGRINAIGALGVSTLVLVIFFPVVHPWYILWAVFPTAPWANRLFFRFAVVVYSVFVSFMVLPRGMGLPPGTVVSIYVGSLAGFLCLITFAMWINRRRGIMS